MTSELGARQVRMVYLITYSQADYNICNSREDFADKVLSAFESSGIEVMHWACSRESDQDGGVNYHMSVKLDQGRRWLRVKQMLETEYKMTVNFSSTHVNYFTAYKYVVKEDNDALHSPGHPDLGDCTSPKSTAASRQRTVSSTLRSSTAYMYGRQKRFSAFDVSEIVVQCNMKTRTQLPVLALAKQQKQDGKTDLAELIVNRGAKCADEDIRVAWELQDAETKLKRESLSCLEILRSFCTKECVNDCAGKCLRIEMDGSQRFTPTSRNGKQQGEKQVSHDLKGTGTKTYDNMRIIGQSKDDIQIREGQNSNMLNNSESGKISDVAGKSQEKAVSEKSSAQVKITEGQVGSKDTAEKPSSSAQIVLPPTAMESNTATNQGAGPAPLHTELLSNDANSILQRSVSADGETQLNQAAIKLLQKLEFKNPGRKQIEYGTFNPESSEREKKKLRRFQNSKPRTGACYKEDGILLDGRDLCDCLTESCPGCFYPCPQCGSQKCGPTCRCNRRWVYDYIEDEARTYKVEFPEAENFGT